MGATGVLLVYSFIYLSAVGYVKGSAPLQKSGSGYTGLVVAIDDSVQENEALIQDIKKLLNDTSRALFDSTNGSAYFHQVTIAVPKSWNITTLQTTKVYRDPYPTSHIRIVPPNPGVSQVAAPSTFQPGGCGEPGEFIEVNTDFVTGDASGLAELYGPKERMLVHEWAHFRFGIFDEYGIPGDDKFPLFYFNDGFLEVSTCPSEVKGWIMSQTSGEPLCDVFDDRVVSDCVFIPDAATNTFDSSIMSLPKLPHVNRFCDQAEARRHNWRAPSKQNIVCDGRSTWDIISGHPDIAEQSKTGFQDPDFNLVQLQDAPDRYILVLDVSASMGYFNGRPMALMKQACHLFIQDIIPDDSYLGMVKFSNEAWVVEKVAKVSNTTRKQFSQGITSLIPISSTAIGLGLQMGLNMLNEMEWKAEGGKILLLTDGEETESIHPTISAYTPELVKAKVQVYSVALGSKATSKLETLALATQGKSFLFADIEGSSSGQLNQILQETITTHGDIDVNRIELMNRNYQLENQTTALRVIVDKNLGKDASFTISSDKIGSIAFDLISPSGKKFTKTDEEFSEDKNNAKRAVYKLATAEAGTWTMNVTKTGPASISIDVSVTSEPSSPNEAPIRVRSWINATIVTYPNVPKVFAHVTQGSDVIIRAKVQALITSDQKRKIVLLLKDDGKGADLLADDGIYSSFFVQFSSSEKRYTVVAEVKGARDALRKQNSGRRMYSSGIPPAKKPVTSGPPSVSFKLDSFRKVSVDPDAGRPSGLPVDDFDRTTNAGSFRVEGYTGAVRDRIKPSSVKDLKVLEAVTVKQASGDRMFLVSLEWTAPGDDMDIGKAETLELRAANSTVTRDSFFSMGHLLENNKETVHNGSLEIQEGGTLQLVTVIVPAQLQVLNSVFDVYFSVRATDKAGNVGDMGNLASAHFGYVIPEKGSDKKGDDGLSGGVIAGIVIGVVAFVAIIVMVIVMVLKRR